MTPSRVGVVDRFLNLAYEVRVFGLGFECQSVCFGFGLLWELERRHGSPGVVANGPNYPHSLARFRAGSARFARGSGLARLWSIESERFGHVVCGPKLEAIEWSASHGTLTGIGRVFLHSVLFYVA